MNPITLSKMNYWLVKSEPSTYSWDLFVSKKEDMWDGVRNYQARNNLMAMKKGDLVFFYHSNEGLEIVGLAEVSKEHYPDPSAEVGNWFVVNLVPVRKLANTVTLKTIKTDPKLQDIALLKQSRLSVVPISETEFNHIIKLSDDV
jgi:predicted RNA-binding protein with PUA-like domain